MAGRRLDLPAGKTGRYAQGSDLSTNWGGAVNPDIDEGDLLYYRDLTMRMPKTAESCCPPANEQPDLRPVEGKEADEELATLAKALGHPARVKILRILVRRTTCICGDIVDELTLAQSTVSQHLKVLKDVGLIRGDVDGPRSCYCIEPRTLRRLKALMGGV
jgi:DNA-binding transcriptional ArsR family regulator